MPEIDERDVRLWFMKTDLEQAEDTFRVVEGIIETRKVSAETQKALGRGPAQARVEGAR